MVLKVSEPAASAASGHVFEMLFQPTPDLLNQKNRLCFYKPSSDSHALSSLGTTGLKILVTERATLCVCPPVQFLTWHTRVTATSWHPGFLCELWGTKVFISFWNNAAQSLGSFPSVAYCFPFFHWWKVLPPGGSYEPCSVWSWPGHNLVMKKAEC